MGVRRSGELFEDFGGFCSGGVVKEVILGVVAAAFDHWDSQAGACVLAQRRSWPLVRTPSTPLSSSQTGRVGRAHRPASATSSIAPTSSWRDRHPLHPGSHTHHTQPAGRGVTCLLGVMGCLLYTSDAADE